MALRGWARLGVCTVWVLTFFFTRSLGDSSVDREFRKAVGTLLDEGDSDSMSDNTDVELDASNDGTSVDGGGETSAPSHRMVAAVELARGVSSLLRGMTENGTAAMDESVLRLRELVTVVDPHGAEMEAADLLGFIPRLLAALRAIHGTEIVPLTGIDIEAATMALNECCWHEAGLMLRPGSESYRPEVMTRAWVPTTTTALVAIHVLNGNSIHVVCPLLVMAMYPLSVSSLGVDPVGYLRRVYSCWSEMLASVDGEVLPSIEPLLELAASMVREGWCGTGWLWVRDVQYSVYDTTRVIHGRGAALMRLSVDTRHRELFSFLRSHERDHLFSRDATVADRYVNGRLGLNMTWIHVAALLTALSLRITRNETVSVDALRQVLSIRYSDVFLRPYQDLIVVSTCPSMYLYVTLTLLASYATVTCPISLVPTPDVTSMEPRVMPVSAALARVAKTSHGLLPLVDEAPSVKFVDIDGAIAPKRAHCERRLRLIESIREFGGSGKRSKWSSSEIKLVTDYYLARLRGDRGARDVNKRIPRLLRRLRGAELEFSPVRNRYAPRRGAAT